jgi:cytochrome c oxidase cbb3-type subunit 4
MDINDLRSAGTVFAFVMFIGIVWWAYSGGRKQAFDEASKLALDDDDIAALTSAETLSKKERK